MSRFGAGRKLGMLLFTVLAAAVLGTSATVAQQASLQSYDVELLIFRHLGGNETQESWGIEAAAAAQRLDIPDEDSLEPPVAPLVAPTVTFPALPASKMKLTAVEETLRRSRDYQPIAHIGWTQPGFDRSSAQYLSLSSLVPAGSGLQGQVALSRGRYLHLTLDLVLDSTATDGQRYVLRQTRRMRSNERHYIDSPKFGVIAVITPTAG
jgi:hypothetical protein